jgi:hypothetical protein
MRVRLARRLLALLAAQVALPAVGAPSVAPTAFETFATRPDTLIAGQRDVGSLTSLDSTLTVTALVAATRTDGQRMRGVRFELRNNGGTERIYLDDRQLAKLEQDVGLMELSLTAGAAQLRGGNSVVGTEACWMPHPVQRILCPEMQWAPAWTGLRIWTFGGSKTFEFRDRTVVELRGLVERSVTELNEL